MKGGNTVKINWDSIDKQLERYNQFSRRNTPPFCIATSYFSFWKMVNKMVICAISKIKARYLLAILGSIGMGIVYGLKVNLSIAIVSMVNNTAVELAVLSRQMASPYYKDSLTFAQDTECNIVVSDESKLEDGPFHWSSSIQGSLKSSYFWGYMVAQFPGGRAAELFSAKWVLFFAVSINVIGTILSPLAAKIHYGVLIAIRVLEGIGGGVTFPAMHVLLANWAPPTERSVMSSLTYSGTALGTVAFTFITGIIAAGLGWEAIFYIEGSLCAIWLIMWGILIADTPYKQIYISDEERQYIMTSLNANQDGSSVKKPPIPWKAICSSPPFLAILVAHTCSNWGWYMVLIELPNYMKHILQFQIAENAVLSSIPFLTLWFFSMTLGKILDNLRSKNLITTTTARKTSTLIASVIPMICLLIIPYIGCQRTVSVVLMTIIVTSLGGMFSGFLSNHIDIAPNLAGSLMGITNTFATIPGIVVPIFVGKLTEADPTISSWKIVFWVTIVLYLIEIVVYSVFGSGEEQKWNKNTSGELQPLKSPE